MARDQRGKLKAGEFAKYHGLGNDYVVIDAETFGIHLTRARIRRLCNRNTGLGSDGILALTPSRRADFGLRIFNPDGSEAEKSGNGLRILSRFLYDLGYTRRKSFSIATKGGRVIAELTLRGKEVSRVKVDMGRATFWSDEIPVLGPRREVIDEQLVVGSQTLRMSCVSVGNPHCVIFVPELSSRELQEFGPLLEHHPSFPRRSNVQFARVASPKLIDVLIWERGAGETAASGSSACAVAAAAHRRELTGRRVQVRMPGGKLSIEIRADFALRMTGPSTPVYRGRLLAPP